MVEAVSAAIQDDVHLLVQAGTGTGKSLGYLVPAFEHATRTGTSVVVATATLALQAQLVGRDLPDLVASIGDRLPRRPTYAILKGRHNYACLYRVNDGVPDEQGTLVEVQPTGSYGREVLALREWANGQSASGADGDRDDAPAHSDKAWAQVSVKASECLGDRCAYHPECFAEGARSRAMAADVVVTNHTLLAIDALEGTPVLPEHDAVVVDEAHELASRVTGVSSAQLSPRAVERAARRASSYCTGDEGSTLEESAEALKAALVDLPAGRLDSLPAAVSEATALVRDAARAALSAFPKQQSDAGPEAGLRVARTLVEQVRTVAERIAGFDPARPRETRDVVWVTIRESVGPELEVAPLSVAGLLRHRLFGQRTCVLTSATLELGGSFDAAARMVGLRPSEREDRDTDGAAVAAGTAVRSVAVGGDGERGSSESASSATADRAAAVESRARNVHQMDAGRAPAGDTATSDQQLVVPWRATDVGSPFDYPKQGILYVARRLPAPGRGVSERALEELCALVEALGGRTLGLFSSRRAAEEATTAVRERVGVSVLCQGDAQLPELGRRFVDEPETSLFGTLSLWQGLDVPGATCQLVVIDRLPFPRPDDPLMSARQRAVDEAGGNGFMSVAATHAALLLAQGSGRLIRRSTDRGVVAVLDSRLATARYGGFLRASLPPMWSTYDREVVLGALRRLRAQQS